MIKNYKIVEYQNTDFKTISSWWEQRGESLPSEILTEDGTFVLEIEGKAALCVTVLLTQVKGMAYLFAFVKNPEFKESLEPYGKQLWSHCFDFAKKRGYQRLICFAPNEKLSEKYERFGMRKTMSNLSSFVRDL